MVHLHVRSAYSISRGILRLPQIVDLALKNDMKAICLSDYHSMHGAYDFYTLCKKNKIKPIFGLEVRVIRQDNDFVYVNVLAKNNDGYHKLLELSTYLCTQSNDGIEIEKLHEYVEDCYVIVLNGGLYETSIIQENKQGVIDVLDELHLCKDVYLGLIHADAALWRVRQEFIKDICKEYQCGYVPVSRILYEKNGDEEYLQVMDGIRLGKSVKTIGEMRQMNRNFKTKEEMRKMYLEEDLEICDRMADSICVDLESEHSELPHFPLPENVTSDIYLKKLCMVGLKKRLNNQMNPVYLKRLEEELAIIHSMHFDDYFLIVWDYVRYSKSQGILTGVGRGSAAGSLVAYVLGITHIDPIQYGLLFERFLNPKRVTMPDIDIDFMDSRREEVIQYVMEKYGKDHVAHIVTFNTLKAKQVLRDVGKYFEINNYDIDLLAKKISSTNMTLMEAYNTNSAFKQAVHSKKELTKLFEYALQLEGLPRHISTHPAGIIIGENSLHDHVPLIRLDDGSVATQFSHENLEALGYLKMDFLGLRNLTIIDEIVQDIKKDTNETIDLLHLDTSDPKTLEVFQSVNTTGIFQFDGDGIRLFLKQLKPKNFDEIVIANAMYRPGPMDTIPSFIEKRNRNEFVSIDPRLDSIVSSTNGFLVYQEQIMALAQQMAGFSYGKADIMRRAMSKKKEKELLVLKEDFEKGALEKGYSKEKIEEVYSLIMKFANYGFNKSHSVSYSYIAFQLAYLKAHYPSYFFKALLNSVIGDEKKTFEYMMDGKKYNLKFLTFSINASLSSYTIENGALRPPLSLVKGIGGIVIHEILMEKEVRGPFKDYIDFVSRMNSKKVNKKHIESLIDVGALDSKQLSRASMLQALDDVIQYGELVRIETNEETQFDFTIVSRPSIKQIKDRNSLRLEREKNALGFYYSSHPLTIIKKAMGKELPLKSIFQDEISDFIVCVIARKKETRTKSGKLMCFLSLQDEIDQVDATVFDREYQQIQDCKVGDFVVVKGRYDKKYASFTINKIEIVAVDSYL